MRFGKSSDPDPDLNYQLGLFTSQGDEPGVTAQGGTSLASRLVKRLGLFMGMARARPSTACTAA